jgi:glyoxylase-like metal-dependent hydrolase (beta-lactamase superfamily II)
MVTRKIPYYEFAEGVFEIDEFDCVSIFVVVGSERALVIDCGTGIGDLRWVIENRITDKPYDVVISHNHGDHIGGAGFFDTIWISAPDSEWEQTATAPTLEFRRQYARLIAQRGPKHYDYTIAEDIRAWKRSPQKKIMEDGHVFHLGGRNVTAYQCPGHTAGEMVFIDDASGTLFAGDACNCNLLLGSGFGKNRRDEIRIAKEGLERILSMKNSYDLIYNGHHDFRGFGNSLYPESLQDAALCLKSLLDKTAKFETVPDPLAGDSSEKYVAVYGNVQVSCMNGDIREY